MNKNNRHGDSLVNKKKASILMIAVLLLAVTIVLYLISFYQVNTRKNTPMRTVQMSTMHPVYGSVESMINAKETSLVAVIELTRVIKGDARVKSATIALMGGAVNGTNYVLEGVPTLKKGDHILVFASRGRDSKYYPLSGGTAIAKYSGRGQYSLTKETIAGNGDNDRSFTADSLKSMVK